MPGALTLGQRIRRALFERGERQGRLTLEQVGALVAVTEGRGKPYKASSVSEWLADRSEPDIKTLQALAQVTGVSDVWLVLGRGPIYRERASDGRNE